MNKRTPEQWQALFVAQQASGLNQAQFCKREGLCPKHFSLRRKQLLGSKATVPVLAPFVKVQAPTASERERVSIHYHGIDIRFTHADPTFIVSVVKQLV